MTVKPASTLVLLRATNRVLEVLMIKRPPWLFGGGWWVFPGGSLEPNDKDAADLMVGVEKEQDVPWIAAALRETAEEVGLCLSYPQLTSHQLDRADLYGSLRQAGAKLDGGQTELLSNWITPQGVEKRFDTRFYAAEWPYQYTPSADPQEVAELEWIAPREMLNRDRRDFQLIQPTFEILMLLNQFASPQAVLSYARQTEVQPFQPPLEWKPEAKMIPLHPNIRALL